MRRLELNSSRIMIILNPVESLSHLFCLDSIPYVTSHSTQEYISDVVVNDADEPVWNIATGICRMACWTAIEQRMSPRFAE